jgi:hypothetical protein
MATLRLGLQHSGLQYRKIRIHNGYVTNCRLQSGLRHTWSVICEALLRRLQDNRHHLLFRGLCSLRHSLRSKQKPYVEATSLRPCSRHQITKTKPSVRFLWNSALEFFTVSCGLAVCTCAWRGDAVVSLGVMGAVRSTLYRGESELLSLLLPTFISHLGKIQHKRSEGYALEPLWVSWQST